MENKLSYKFWIHGLIVIILALGIFFRFVNLDKKVYWHDEVHTKLHLSGYYYGEWHSALFNGQIHSIEDLQKYQRLSSEKGLNDTLKTLAIDDPHHPPLYYIISRFWVQYLGNSITAIRSLSAFLSLLAFPAIYWLCLELFSSSTVGWVAVCLLAVSPLFVLYAQEAREYSLWTALILTSSGALLRAIQITSLTSKSVIAWGVYGITLMMGLYTSLFTSLLIVAHGIYVIIRAHFRLPHTLINYLIAVAASLLLFLPWIIVFITNYEQYQRSTNWTKLIKISPLELLQFLGLNISRVFVDLGGEFEHPLIFIVIAIVLILVGYGFYFLYQTTLVKVWGFIFTLVIVPITFLLIPDLLWGGIRSLSPRYLIPSWIGIILTVAYLLTTYLKKSRRIWSAIAAIVFSAGVLSCVVNSQANTSWTKVISYSLPKVADIINQSSSPLLVGNNTSYNPGNLIALSYLLKSEVKLQLLSDEKGYIIPDGFSEIFLLSPSDEFKEKLEQKRQVNVEQLFKDNYLWLEKIRLSAPSTLPQRR